MTSKMTWVYNPNKISKVKLPPHQKEALKALADEFVVKILKTKHIQPPPEKLNHNYMIDIYSAWRVGYFYFISTRACPFPNAISPTFDMAFARIKMLQKEFCDLSYMRHNGQWVTLEHQIELKTAFDLILQGGHYEP